MEPSSLPAVIAVAAALLSATATQAATYPNPGYVTGDIDAVHDPSMIRAADGRYLINLIGYDSSGRPCVY